MPTLAEIRRYLEKSGDDAFRWEWELFEFDGGWFNWFVNHADNQFCIGQAYGPHEALAFNARQMARAMGCNSIVFATKRNGAAFARLTGSKIIATVLELPLEDK